MKDLKLLLEVLIKHTEDFGMDKSYLADYIDGKIEAFNTVLDYVNFKIEMEK